MKAVTTTHHNKKTYLTLPANKRTRKGYFIQSYSSQQGGHCHPHWLAVWAWPSWGLEHSGTTSSGMRTGIWTQKLGSHGPDPTHCATMRKQRQGESRHPSVTSPMEVFFSPWPNAGDFGERQKSSDHSSQVAQMVKNLPTMRDTWLQPLGQEYPLEEEVATHSSVLAWRIPWTERSLVGYSPSMDREEPGGLQSVGVQRVGHEWVTKTLPHTHSSI